MTAALDLGTARARAESLMTSTCMIRVPGSTAVTDSTTGEVTFPAGAVVYSGPCRVRSAGTQGATTEAGAVQLFDYDFLVDIPFSATGTAAGQQVTISTSPDPDLVGLQVEVQKPYRGDQIIRRQLACREVA